MVRYNSDTHHRHSLRLQGYDYSGAEAYFVTICAQNRECMFGEIVDEKVILNNAGRVVESTWNELSQHYEGVETDEYIVMPNHFHGIIILVGAGPCACPINDKSQHNTGQPQGVAPTLSLPDIVHRFRDRQRDFPHFFHFFFVHTAFFVKIPKLTIHNH